jgi:hypothetical protein
MDRKNGFIVLVVGMILASCDADSTLGAPCSEDIERSRALNTENTAPPMVGPYLSEKRPRRLDEYSIEELHHELKEVEIIISFLAASVKNIKPNRKEDDSHWYRQLDQAQIVRERIQKQIRLKESEKVSE